MKSIKFFSFLTLFFCASQLLIASTNQRIPLVQAAPDIEASFAQVVTISGSNSRENLTQAHELPQAQIDVIASLNAVRAQDADIVDLEAHRVRRQAHQNPDFVYQGLYFSLTHQHIQRLKIISCISAGLLAGGITTTVMVYRNNLHLSW